MLGLPLFQGREGVTSWEMGLWSTCGRNCEVTFLDMSGGKAAYDYNIIMRLSPFEKQLTVIDDK